MLSSKQLPPSPRFTVRQDKHRNGEESMAAQAETATKPFPFSGGGKGAACQGGGYPRGMEEHWGAGWEEAGRGRGAL